MNQGPVKRPDPHPSKETAQEAITAFVGDILKSREEHGIDSMLMSCVTFFKKEEKEDMEYPLVSVQAVGTELETELLMSHTVRGLIHQHDNLATEQPK